MVVALPCSRFLLFFFFNDTATTEIYTLSLHDALPISWNTGLSAPLRTIPTDSKSAFGDRKSTRLNSSHPSISYAVFCLKKKKNKTTLLLIETKRRRKKTETQNHKSL